MRATSTHIDSIIPAAQDAQTPFFSTSGGCSAGRLPDTHSYTDHQGEINGSFGKYVRYRVASRVSRVRLATAAWAPM